MPLFSKTVPTAGKESLMRDSDKRKFKERVAKMYPAMGTEQLNQLLPKEAPVTVGKLHPKDELISRGRDPIFFSHRESRVVEGKGKSSSSDDELIPSCYALHAAPQALCRVVVVYPGLEKQVCRGADLFLPGVVRPGVKRSATAAAECENENDDDGDGGETATAAAPLSATEALEDLCLALRQPWPVVLFGSPPVKKGELCCLASAASPWAPYAVGRFHRSAADYELAGLTKGMAVEVLHHQGDALWLSGSRAEPDTRAPPESLAAAFQEAARVEAEREAHRVRCKEEREAAQAVANIALRLEEVPRLRRKAEKALRQIEDLKAKLAVNGGGGYLAADAAQAAKLAKEQALRDEIASLNQELEELNNPKPPPPPPPPPPPLTASTSMELGGEEESDWVVVAGEDEDGLSEGVSVLELGVDSGGSGESDAEEAGEAGAVDGEEEEEVDGGGGDDDDDGDMLSELDELFRDCILTELSIMQDGNDSPTPGKPLLLSTLFGRASSRGGGVGVKSTQWKSSAAFFARALPEGLVDVRFAAAASVTAGGNSTSSGGGGGSSKGGGKHGKAGGAAGQKGGSRGAAADTVVGFDASLAPPFQHVVPRQPGSSSGSTGPGGGGGSSGGGRVEQPAWAAPDPDAAPPVRATKKGGRPVVVCARRVRNHLVTFVDGLEEWGFEKEGMESLARDLRKMFSVASGVAERIGTEDNVNKGRKQLFSVKLGGKFVDQVAAVLRQRGVSGVTTTASKGIVSKKDKQHYKGLLS